MLYELALPGLLAQGGYRWLRAVRRSAPQQPALRLRTARSRLRRLEIDLLDRLSPTLAARLLLRRFHQNQSETPTPIPTNRDQQLITASDAFHCSGIYVRQFGPTNGPRVLLVHGWNADGRMMLPLAQDLADRGFRIDVPDLPGTGESRGPVRSFVAVARRLKNMCPQDQPYEVLIGHSAGGLIAMIALGLGLKARRLVTLSAPSSLDRLMELYLRFTGQPAKTGAALMRGYAKTCGRELAEIGPAECRKTTLPMLVIHAQHDWQVPPAEAQRICAARDGLTPIYLRNCNHRSVLQHPELLGLMERFFHETSNAGSR
ncbi:alpha/beta hydrolase [Phaeobacter inhibens]|uniref:alpha/beta fold hydrolase n=1 Tax=Phaeobacter inhibens TaxID=221822 RepID=UPI0021A560B2|nr:alpha/beta hydrolase [Phaeobacter inhibens]UWR69862.1 alpha/beta hydrolase [Phaeobacter inhibens]